MSNFEVYRLRHLLEIYKSAGPFSKRNQEDVLEKCGCLKKVRSNFHELILGFGHEIDNKPMCLMFRD